MRLRRHDVWRGHGNVICAVCLIRLSEYASRDPDPVDLMFRASDPIRLRILALFNRVSFACAHCGHPLPQPTIRGILRTLEDWECVPCDGPARGALHLAPAQAAIPRRFSLECLQSLLSRRAPTHRRRGARPPIWQTGRTMRGLSSLRETHSPRRVRRKHDSEYPKTDGRSGVLTTGAAVLRGNSPLETSLAEAGPSEGGREPVGPNQVDVVTVR